VAITFAEVARARAGEFAAHRPARMMDLVETEQMIEQAHVPVGGAARADAPARAVLRARRWS
jgi:hypothetical protein